MDLHFLSPDLRRLDEAPTEILLACLFEDERPVQGVAGLVNWRLAGRLDRLLEGGFLTGKLGEVMMIPGGPRLRADKVLLVGLGPLGTFDERVFDEASEKIFETLRGLAVRSALVELPGRHVDAISPESAADRFFELASAEHYRFDAFVLLERPAAHKRITQHMVEERRRIRRV